jgi:hypothetical protein
MSLLGHGRSLSSLAEYSLGELSGFGSRAGGSGFVAYVVGTSASSPWSHSGVGSVMVLWERRLGPCHHWSSAFVTTFVRFSFERASRILLGRFSSWSSYMSAHGVRFLGDPWFAAFCRLTILESCANSSFEVRFALCAARAARRVECVGWPSWASRVALRILPLMMSFAWARRGLGTSM